MAHRKAGGSTQLGRDSRSQRLGVKIFGNQKVKTGNIIIRQHGTKFHAGENVKRCNDDTLMSLVDGVVKFTAKKVRNFAGKLVLRRYVSVIKSDSPIEIKPKHKNAKKKDIIIKKTKLKNKAGKKKGPRKIVNPNERKTIKKHIAARTAKKRR